MISASQLKMLEHCADGDPTDYADFADRAGSPLGWRNRERVISALIRKGLLDDDLKVTDAGRQYLPTSKGL
jgi:hypothetical protein